MEREHCHGAAGAGQTLIQRNRANGHTLYFCRLLLDHVVRGQTGWTGQTQQALLNYALQVVKQPTPRRATDETRRGINASGSAPPPPRPAPPRAAPPRPATCFIFDGIDTSGRSLPGQPERLLPINNRECKTPVPAGLLVSITASFNPIHFRLPSAGRPGRSRCGPVQSGPSLQRDSSRPEWRSSSKEPRRTAGRGLPCGRGIRFPLLAPARSRSAPSSASHAARPAAIALAGPR